MGLLHSLLIVDDERVIREGLSTMVDWADLGFEITGVLGDGREALRHLEQSAVDAILTDIRMTFVSGLDLAREVRQRFPHTKVVLLSGHREFELAQQAVAAGVHGYLLKPVDFSELRSVFRELADVLTKEEQEREAARLEAERRVLDREVLLQQFIERVLADREIGHETIADRYRRLGATQTLAGRPCGIVTVSAAHRERRPALPDEIGALLAGGENAIRYTPIVIASHPEGQDRRRFFAHAEQPLSVDEFVARVKRTARETVSGLAEMFGLTVAIEVDRYFEDLLQAAGCVSSAQSETTEPAETNGGPAVTAGAETAGLSPPPNRLVERAKQFLADHYREPIGLTETACALGVTPPYLSRLFHAHSDTTLIDYLTKLRVERAMQLLSNGNRSVAEVAAEIGYASSSHFSRVFKKLTGSSPADYRRHGSLSHEAVER